MAANHHVGPNRVRPSDRVTELDGLRGLLAWTVVASHVLLTSGWFDPLLPRFPILGEIPESAVDIFMLLSGFAITHVLMQRPSTIGYFVRRACRIVPVYYFALVLGILLTPIMANNYRHLPPETIGSGYVWICELGSRRLWIDGPLHFLFLHGLVPAKLLPAAAYTLLGVAWSLSLEFQFYLIAPAIFAFVRRWRGALVVLALGIVLTTFFAGKIMAVFSNAFLPAKAAFFFVGALGYFAVQRTTSTSRVWLLSVLPGVVLASFWWLGTRHVYEAIIPPLVWTAVIVAVRLDRLRFLRAALNARMMQTLGRISYSTYLLHVPVIVIFQAAIWRWLPPSSTKSLLVMTTAVVVPAVFFASWLSWRFIELPFQRLGKRYCESAP